jgi:hypothetical protein
MFFWQQQDETSHEYKILRDMTRARIRAEKLLAATG